MFYFYPKKNSSGKKDIFDMGVPILGGWGGGLTTWEKFPRFIVFCSGGPPLWSMFVCKAKTNIC